MARQLIKPGDTDRLINAKVAANLAEIGLLSAHHERRPDFVRSPRGAAHILDDLLEGAAGPSFLGAARNFRSFSRSANARFEAAYVALGPIVVSDFKDADHSLNGAPKTYADLWDAPTGHLALVTDVGLVQDYHGTANVSGTATANATLFDAVQPQLGYSGVIDITPTWDPAQQANPSFYCYTGLFAHSPNLAFELEVFPDVQHGQLFTNDIQLNTAADALLNGVSNRFAYTATPTLLAISINGGPVITAANSGDYSGIDFLGLSVFQSAGSGFKSIIEKLKLYRARAPEFLPALSKL